MPLELLNSHQIRHELGALDAHLSLLEILPMVDSTNQYLLARKAFPGSYAVLAEQQTAGRGRMGRRWISPPGGNIYLSLLWHFPTKLCTLAALYQAVGAAALRALSTAGIQPVTLKWPNDVFSGSRKIGGILIETAGTPTGPCQAVIGVGLNVRHPPRVYDIDQPWTDIYTLQPLAANPNRLAGLLLRHLLETLLLFPKPL